MTSCRRNCNIKEDRGREINDLKTNIDEQHEDPLRYLDDMEDEMLKKKKVRLTGKYKEKRYIP